MKEKNIFVTGGEVSDDSVIGYKDKYIELMRSIECKLGMTGGIYIHGLYRTGKTSLIKSVIASLDEKNNNLVCLYINLNDFNTNSSLRYAEFLEGIVDELKDKLDEIDHVDLTTVYKKISEYESADKSSMKYRMKFMKIFKFIKKAGLNLLLVIDEFDAAKDIFSCKSDFELFRELVASNDYSTCLVTVSRQELSLIENENPNNSSFKGVMHPFPIKGFNDNDINEYRRIMNEYYDHILTDDNISTIKYYCGSSPYLWSCVGYEIAECKLLQKDVCLDKIFSSVPILSTIGGFHDSIFKCLEHDKDRNGVNYAEKLASIIIGPSFLATDEDIKLLISMNYLLDTGSEYLAFSFSFKKYLMGISYSNDVLNNFDTLEKKMKLLLEKHKSDLFAAASASDSDEDNNWYTVLRDTWNNIESKSFNDSSYRSQIRGTYRRFHKNETVLGVMSLEDALRIVRNYWSEFSYKFNNETLDKWEEKFKDCGTARNPVHHGSKNRIYTIEEQTRINSYCMEIIKQLS